MAAHPQGDPWVLVADVLARAAGVDPSRSFDAAASALAKTMRGVRFDWDDRPCITWSVAEELRDSLRAEAARKREEIERRAIAADAARRAALPRGIPAALVPDGVPAGLWAMLNDPDRVRSKRQTVLEHSLENPAGAIVYTSVNEGAS
jgi:hypothetical protein